MAGFNVYRCEACGATTRALVSAENGYTRPTCCARSMEWLPDGAPHVGALNWTYTEDDGTERVINTVQEARAIERESEIRARNEPGAQPVIFRHLSQDRSNRDVHTLARDPRVVQPPSLDEIDPGGRIRRKITVGEMDAAQAERTPLGPGVA